MLRFELQNDSKLITFFKKIQYLGLLFFKCSFVKLLKVILSFFFQMLYTSFIANVPEVSDLSGQDKARTEVITVRNDI